MEREALKLALHELEGIPFYRNYGVRISNAIAAIKEALAQPAQKPVAWLQIGVGPLHEGDVLARTTKPKEWNPKWWKFEPLYTIPPQREWVGLTDAEIDEGNKQSWVSKQAWQSAVWWASEKLKERNHGT